MKNNCNCYGEQLTLAGTAIAIQLSHGKTPEEIAVLSSLLDAVSSQLDLLAATKLFCAPSQNTNPNNLILPGAE